MRLSMFVAPLAGALLASALACNAPHVIAADLAEKEILTKLAERGLPITKVSCPTGRPARAGETFACTVAVEDGEPALVDVSVLDETGRTSWELRGVIVHEKLMAEGITAESHGVIRVVCPDKVIVVPVGASFTCQGGSGEALGHIAITIVDKTGNETWKLVP